MPDMYRFSEQFQLKILALMARDKTSFISYREVLQPKFFKKDIHIDMARIIVEHYEHEMQRAKSKKTSINIPTLEILFEEVRKLTEKYTSKKKIKRQYEDLILDIMDADLSDAEYVKENVISFGRRSAMEHAILESVDDIEKGVEDFSPVEERISKAIRIGEDIDDLGCDYFAEAEERMKIYETGTDGVRRIPTGLSGLDRIMNGGLGNGELGVVIAPPNRGKSFTLINIGAGAVSEGFNVAHFTLEMPEAQVSKRYDERLTKKSFDYIKQNTNKVLVALNNMIKCKMGKLFIKKFKVNECNINTIRSYLTRLEIEKGFKPDLIVIDYGDLVQSLRKYKDKRFELESVYLDMRDLAEEYGCPVWTASQANRKALSKSTVSLDDLAEAFNKANIADFMVALCQTDEEKKDGVMRWHVAKQRDGIAGVILDGDVDYSTATMSVYESSQ